MILLAIGGVLVKLEDGNAKIKSFCVCLPALMKSICIRYISKIDV